MQESLDAGKSQTELEAIKAARLARFGEVDPADLKQRGGKGGDSQDKDKRSKRRDRKRDRKQANKQKHQDKSNGASSDKKPVEGGKEQFRGGQASRGEGEQNRGKN